MNGPQLVVTEDDKISLAGMQLCAGCEDRFVLSGYCSSCRAINLMLENRREQQRINLGVAPYEQPFEALDPQAIPTPVALGAMAVVAIAAATFVLAGAWFGFREVVAFCLGHS